MLDGSWLMAQGSWLMAKGGQGRLMAHGQGAARPRGPKGRPQVRAQARLGSKMLYIIWNLGDFPELVVNKLNIWTFFYYYNQ